MGVLTDTDMKLLMDLRRRGFAVCVFTPQELEAGQCSRRAMEDYLATEGNELLELDRKDTEEPVNEDR